MTPENKKSWALGEEIEYSSTSVPRSVFLLVPWNVTCFIFMAKNDSKQNTNRQQWYTIHRLKRKIKRKSSFRVHVRRESTLVWNEWPVWRPIDAIPHWIIFTVVRHLFCNLPVAKIPQDFLMPNINYQNKNKCRDKLESKEFGESKWEQQSYDITLPSLSLYLVHTYIKNILKAAWQTSFPSTLHYTHPASTDATSGLILLPSP